MKKESIYDRRINATLLVAFASLKHNGEKTDQENIRAEKYRLDRILAEEYKKDKTIKEYNQFCLDWIKSNAEDFVKTDKWLYDVDFGDDQYQLNIDLLHWLCH